MFGKIKDFNQMRKQAGELQAQLAKEQIEVAQNGVKIIMNGNQEVLEINIDEEVDRSQLPEILKTNFNQAVKKVQQLMAQKMMGGQGM